MTTNREQNPQPERKIRVRGELLVVSRGARLRPVEDYLHVAEKARAIKAARKVLSQEKESE